MADAVESLIVDLVEWVDARERTYEEVMSAWRTSCPRLPIWEDACDRGLVTTDYRTVRVTDTGRALLRSANRSAAPSSKR